MCIRVQLELYFFCLEIKFHHIAIVPNVISAVRVIKEQISKTIYDGLTFVSLITTIAMLMMIDYRICSCINKETVGLYHS